jgi:apolipoprotein N-acyltransferase
MSLRAREVAHLGCKLALASLSGFLLVLACPDVYVGSLAWFSLVPTLWLIDQAPTWRYAAFMSFVTGLVFLVGASPWTISLVERVASAPRLVGVFVWLLHGAYQAVVFALFGWGAWAIRRSTRLPMALVAPLVMVTCELAIPMLFPWYLAITQTEWTAVIQVADLAGPLGVTALVMAVNGALFDLLARRRQGLRPALIVSAILAAALVYGHVRIQQVTAQRGAAPKLQVGIVQPNVGFDSKGLEHGHLALEQVKDLQRESQALEAEGAELIVWPESAFPIAIPRHITRDAPPGIVGNMRRGFTAPLVTGVQTEDTSDPSSYPTNSALMVDREGRFTGRFDKIFRVWIGERIPGIETFPSLRRFLPRGAGHFAGGNEVVTLPFVAPDGHEYRLGPMICLEDILPRFGRELAALHPHLLVNLTNDAWFGKSSEPWQHLALSTYRSVELRTDLVRATNTGVSAWIDATGRVFKTSTSVDPTGTPRGADRFLAPAALLEGGHTVYAALGDVFAYACAGATVFLWLILPWWRRRREHPQV